MSTARFAHNRAFAYAGSVEAIMPVFDRRNFHRDAVSDATRDKVRVHDGHSICLERFRVMY